MSNKTKEEKLQILHKRLLEISNKQAQEEKNNKISLEVKIEDSSNSTPSPIIKNNKLKTYLIRIFILVGIFLIFKNLNLSNLSFENIFSEKEKNTIDITDPNKEVKTISYNLKPVDVSYILLGEYNSEEKAIQDTDKVKSILGEIDFEVSYEYLPNISNSELQIYKTIIGPFNLVSEAKQWSKIIGKNSEIINL
jgi:hypothetical protein|tara:strand:+ start:7940 stop:8521 length:582 start_codon:yes stop_codon:yes gene_type:complete